jgi:thiamine pyrophosphate-dependent acetolactate synthase large subunit-like protein
VDKPRHGGHLFAAALKQEGVRNLFTLSGGHIAPIYDGCVAEGIRIVDFRHEQAAAHAADGWARVTGRPGVAAVTAGPGVTDAVTGMANAMYANSPMVVLGGKSPLGELERGSLQEMDHVTLVRSITKWARTCWETGRIADYVTEGFRHATAGRMGPVFLDIPLDVQFNVWPAGVEVPTDVRTEARSLGDPQHIAVHRSVEPRLPAGEQQVCPHPGGLCDTHAASRDRASCMGCGPDLARCALVGLLVRSPQDAISSAPILCDS